jgi:AAA domain
MSDARDVEDNRLLEAGEHKRLVANYFDRVHELCFLRLRNRAGSSRRRSASSVLSDSETACASSRSSTRGIERPRGRRRRSCATRSSASSARRTSTSTESGCCVVAPYNAQVRRLRTAIPDQRIRIGTVDKFQGQEAPVVFYSMASSSGDDVPRGLDFLFSRNRLNVAISRAKCLAYLVASPRLLDANCKTVEQMLLANALCRLVEEAKAA